MVNAEYFKSMDWMLWPKSSKEEKRNSRILKERLQLIRNKEKQKKLKNKTLLISVKTIYQKEISWDYKKCKLDYEKMHTVTGRSSWNSPTTIALLGATTCTH